LALAALALVVFGAYDSYPGDESQRLKIQPQKRSMFSRKGSLSRVTIYKLWRLQLFPFSGYGLALAALALAALALVLVGAYDSYPSYKKVSSTFFRLYFETTNFGTCLSFRFLCKIQCRVSKLLAIYNQELAYS